MYVYINPCLADGDCAKPSSVTTSLLNLCTLSSGLNFLQPRTKNTELEEKKVLVTNTSASLRTKQPTRQPQQLTTVEKTLLIPSAPCAGC